MTDMRLKWTPVPPAPTKEGWYWVKWKKGEMTVGQIGMFYFDASEYDTYQLSTRAEMFYGPLQTPPEDDE